MLGDLLLSTSHESRKGFADPGGEPIDKGFVEFCPPFGFTFSAPGSQISVSETLVFRQLERPLFDQQPLPLVSLAGPAPFQDHCRQKRMLARASRQRRIAGRKKDELIQIGACQT